MPEITDCEVILSRVWLVVDGQRIDVTDLLDRLGLVVVSGRRTPLGGQQVLVEVAP